MNQNIDETVAVKVAEKHGFLLEIKHRGDASTQQAAKEKQYQILSQLESLSPARWKGPGSITLKRGWAKFLDAKSMEITRHDGAMQAIHVLEPAIVTIHASGGRAMMEDAKAAALAIADKLKAKGVEYKGPRIKGPHCRMSNIVDTEGNAIILHQLDAATS